jgi:hypothetical protein
LKGGKLSRSIAYLLFVFIIPLQKVYVGGAEGVVGTV